MLIKKELEYIELSTNNNNNNNNTWSFTIFLYKFSNFELLYDSSLWVFIANVGNYESMIFYFAKFI